MEFPRDIALCWLARALSAVARRVHSVSSASNRVAVLSVAAHGANRTILPTLVRALDASLEIHSLTSATALPSLEADVGIVCVENLEDVEALELPYTNGKAWILVGFSATPTGLSLRLLVHESSRLDAASLKTAAQPLEELRTQCGLPLALELLEKLSNPPPSTPTASLSLLAAPVAAHLPFQLLLMLLRWSYFHPRVVALVQAPWMRKLALLPQPRVRREIEALYSRYARVWREVYGADALPDLVLVPLRRVRLVLPPDVDNDDADATLPPLERLSQCALWDKQKQFYRDLGIKAWSDHLIPFGVSSSSYLAMQYARLAVDFLRSTAANVEPSMEGPNCFVWEAASGSCKFLHAFLLHFYELVDREQLTTRYGLVPCVIATDLSDQVLASRESMACFVPYLADGRLDFAVFDTKTFLHDGDKRGVLKLRRSGLQWRVGAERGPVFIVGNYFFDSLRSDVLVVTQHEDHSIAIREARIDATTDCIPDMLFSLTTLPHHPRDSPVYTRPALNAALVATLDRLEALWNTDTPLGGEAQPSDVVNSSLVLFPVEAIAFLDAVLSPSNELAAFPVAVVTGDATVSFRDAVPSTFIDTTTGDLEIPQLSPHPDCFCLPVDLEVLQLAVSSTGSASIVSTPSSDTFNVFFAVSSSVAASTRTELVRRFHDVLDQFTPCDCDLLWGLMSVDDGATHLSAASQMALLAQTAWDFDVFCVVQWSLLHRWNQQEREGLDAERDRQRLVDAGRQSFKTFYVLDESDLARCATSALTQLQIARWFYELRAFADAEAILKSVECKHERLRVASTYLLGLVAFHRNDLWTALSWFRKGQQLEPNRLRLKKWVARTLIRLQEAMQHVD